MTKQMQVAVAIVEFGLVLFMAVALYVCQFSIGSASWWYSGLIGGLVFLISSVFFTYNAFRFVVNESNTAADARSFYSGEVGKFSLTLVGFGVSYQLAPSVNVVVMLCTYALMTAAHVFIVAYLGTLRLRSRV